MFFDINETTVDSWPMGNEQINSDLSENVSIQQNLLVNCHHYEKLSHTLFYIMSWQ